MHRVDALMAALDLQAAPGERVQPWQLSRDSPCPGWRVRDVMNHAIGVTCKSPDFAAGATGRPVTPAGDSPRDSPRDRFLGFLGRTGAR